MIINEKGGNLVIIDLFVSELLFEKLVSTWHCGKCTGDMLYKIAPASKKLQEASRSRGGRTQGRKCFINKQKWDIVGTSWEGNHEFQKKRNKQTNKQTE